MFASQQPPPSSRVPLLTPWQVVGIAVRCIGQDSSQSERLGLSFNLVPDNVSAHSGFYVDIDVIVAVEPLPILVNLHLS